MDLPAHLQYELAQEARAYNKWYHHLTMWLPRRVALAFGLRHRMVTRARAADKVLPAAVSHASTVLLVHCNILPTMQQHLAPCLQATQALLFVASLCDMTEEQIEEAVCARMVNTRRPIRYARAIPFKGRRLGEPVGSDGGRDKRLVWALWANLRFLTKSPVQQQRMIDVTAWRILRQRA